MLCGMLLKVMLKKKKKLKKVKDRSDFIQSFLNQPTSHLVNRKELWESAQNKAFIGIRGWEEEGSSKE